ncbi:PREDICTED: uncharacterized protein LOC108562229 isoform X2 [Nicrophorus vespilloides]|uniref:Uncharacterized protein LOC108562229 isoform X2 n=1 Tax=Nicrophorus vespilloides TaxID=110193 RepID=A0ABM1MN39_NICVS|nr:PREDICTED: uncharacterized protein LOC108562229 isoform X2 [Nicrophorus vespilloides]
MASNVFLEILILVNVFFIKGFTSETGVISKISDVDVQTCIENFDIHKDKIIRTQDSRAMGAKYLNEIDLDSREECLRLCCETENCDVFVYEEKKAGSCYLFQCGPPEDFKCKFAHHVNYTSAVLAVNRHLPDLESQIRLTKHEEDLTKLRKPEVKLETTTVTTTTTRKAILKTKTPETKRKCSNYQFECRSTGECIAIYNACDGIPQCADGSDEAPELRCPESTTLTPVISIKKTPIETKSNAPDDKSRIVPYQSVQQEEVYKAQMMQHPQDFLKPDPLLNPLHSRNYNAHQIPQYQQYMPPQQQQQPPNWGARELPPPVYADKNSHIFNHKEVGLQVSDVGEARYNKYKGAMQTLHRALGYGNNAGQLQYVDTRDYGKIPSYYGSEVYRQPPILPPNWEKPQPPVYRKDSNIQPVYIDEQRPSVEEPKWTQETLKHEQDKMAHELKHSKEHFETDKKKTESHQSHSSSHSHYAVVAEYKTTADEVEDGIVPIPGGALLSLIIGFIVMICLGILIACRTKAMRARRYSRKGKSYAHDADYLVNGMYL